MTLTAAERARRYRARRRDGAVTVRDGSVLNRDALDDRLGRVEALLEELVAALIHTPAGRDVTARHAVPRDVTKASRTEGAPARVRGGTAPTPPTGVVGARIRDVTPAPADRILEMLQRSPASVRALADALDAPAPAIVAALVELQNAGRIVRLAGSRPGDLDRWAVVVVESPSETIACRAYREHQTLGHRRDPATHRFRCYVCEPDVGLQVHA